jgi:hypothetical protein
MVARASRAGRPDPTELSAEQTSFLVDASNELRFDLINVNPEDIPNLPPGSHAFWYEDPWVSGDMLVQFLLDRPPDQRGLDAQATAGGKRYWGFPTDFDVRVRRILHAAIAPEPAPEPNPHRSPR